MSTAGTVGMVLLVLFGAALGFLVARRRPRYLKWVVAGAVVYYAGFYLYRQFFG